VDLSFGPKAPEGSRGWWVWFRFYSPAEAFFDKSWQLSDFEMVK
jgi:hypothetical protein